MHRLASILFFCTSALWAQGGIEGVVLDPSGRAIPAARIECSGQSAETDPEGRFRFTDIDRCEAAVSARGFETKRIEIVSGARADIRLDLAGLAQRVVVSATRHETTAEEAGVAASIVTRTDLERREYPAVPDLLREIPGLQVAQYGRPGSLAQVFARGAQRTGTLVLIDGVPVNDPGGEINLANLSSTSIDHLEVVRGPESALFGAEASAGVVQLFTRRGNPEDRVPRGSVSYERGSFGTDRWTAGLSGGAGGRLDYALTAEQFHTAGEYVNDSYRNTTGTANVGLRLAPGTELRGIFRTFDSWVGTPNQVGYGIVDHNANEATRDSMVSVRLDDARGSYLQQVSFGYHRLHDLFLDPGPDGPYAIGALVRDVTAPVPRTYLERLVDPNFPASAVPPGLRLVVANVDWLLYPSDPYLNLTSRKDFEYQGTLSHRSGAAMFGYAYEREGGDITGRGVSRDNHALFVHKQQAVAGRLFLTGGVRLEQNSAFGTKLTPRAAASLRVAGAHGALSSAFLRASASRGITEPTLIQNFSHDAYSIGNPSLRPEKTTSYEVGIVQEWFSRRLRTEVAAFDNSFQDLIIYNLAPFPQASTWQNVEASRARGLEFSSQARFARYFRLTAGYTKLWTRITRSSSPDSLFTGVGQELAHRPGNSGAVSLSVAPARWWFQAGAVFMGERQDYDLFGVTRARAYQNVYAAGGYRLNRRLTPFLRAGNLLNSRYSEVLGYPTLSRSINGGMRVEW